MSDFETVPNEAIGCSHVDKAFGTVVANRNVSISIATGEVHAVIGENGAGKSTLMSALYGVNPPDRGEVRFFGRRIARPSVAVSIENRVGMVHQHFMLVDTLTVAENIVLGNEPVRGLRLDLERAARGIDALGQKYGLAVESQRRMSALSVGEAQRVEIVKVLWRGAEVLILDEPTAVLSPPEVEHLFAVLRTLVSAGKTVVLVTHKLDEVMSLSHRVTVMRRGEVKARLETQKTSADELSHLMVGREVTVFSPPPRRENAPARLEVKDLQVLRPGGGAALMGVDLTVHEGEIVGVASVQGNGESELGLAVAGLVSPAKGRIVIDGQDLTTATVASRQRGGLGHVPEDRHAHGMVLEFSLRENVLLGQQDKYARFAALDEGGLTRDTDRIIRAYDVRPVLAEARAATLSGGNQQKIVVGRELGRSLRALVCAQPTRGVDIGAIERIHQAIVDRATAGVGVLLISSELDELFRLAHRILVLHRGRIAGAFDNHGNVEQLRSEIGMRMLGGHA